MSAQSQNENSHQAKYSWFEGKTILITGATSGIGRALAILLSNNGATVIAHGRTQARLDDLAQAINTENFFSVIGDLAEERGYEAIESTICDLQPDVLILNAGYNIDKKYASEYSDAEIHEMLRVNFTSPILCARTFSRLPKLSIRRRLAFILSTSCFFARTQMSLYVACKTGLMGFGKVLQQEANQLGVQTTLFYPGRTDTSFREVPNSEYMKPESVAHAIASILCLPDDLIPYEFTFRPTIDTYI
jgi:short-subunit dehydrogenase